MLRPCLRAVALVTGAALVPAIASGQQLLVVDVPAGKDGTIYQDATGSIANGSGPQLFIGVTGGGSVRRTVLQFPVQNHLPPGAHILGAELRLNVSRAMGSATTPVSLHRVGDDWGEGASVAPGEGGSGAPAQAGDVTWLHRFYPGSPWLTTGGDFVSVARASQDVPSLGPVSFGPTRAMIADVQEWADHPSTNFGWMLRSSELVPETRRFDSREHATITVRPVLRVSFLPPGTAYESGTGCIGSGNLPLRLQANSNPVQGNAAFTLTTSQGVPFEIGTHVVSTDLELVPWAIAPGCNVRLAPFFPQAFLLDLLRMDGQGRVARTYPIPLEPGLHGTPLALQTFMLDPGTANQFVLSNGLMLVLQ